MKRNFLEYYGFDKLPILNFCIEQGRNGGKVQSMDDFAKDKMEHLLCTRGCGEYKHHVELLLKEFREEYTKIPIAYPGDFYFYNFTFDFIEFQNPKHIVDYLRDRMEQHFSEARLELSLK